MTKFYEIYNIFKIWLKSTASQSENASGGHAHTHRRMDSTTEKQMPLANLLDGQRHKNLISPNLEMYAVKQKKGSTFLLWINLLIHNAISQNLVLLLFVNITTDITYFISGIYTDFHKLLYKKCDVGY